MRNREKQFKLEGFRHNVKSLKACLRTVNIIDCTVAKNEGDKAIKVTKELISKGIFNAEETLGSADAFRYCFWSGSMARRMGGDKARNVGELQEKLGGTDLNAPETQMDLKNNQVGIYFGELADSDDEVRQRCLGAVRKGRLTIINGPK